MAKVVTGKVRLSYLHVFEPVAIGDSDQRKYSLSIIIPKSDKKTIARIEAGIKKTMEEGKAKWGGKIPKNLKLPLRDGDIDREDDPAYENSYFFTASSRTRPGIVDRDLMEIIDPEELYSGCYGRVSVNFYAFNTAGNKGIAAGLLNIQKLADGEPLTSRSTPEEDFGDAEEEDDPLA